MSLRQTINTYTTELYKYCYGEQYVPLGCITAMNSSTVMYGLFFDSKFDHQQKIDIIMTGIKRVNFGEAKEQMKLEDVTTGKQNDSVDMFCTNLLEFCHDNKMIPLITILGKSNGMCQVFDNGAFRSDIRIEVLAGGLETLGVAIRREMKEMKVAKHLDLHKGNLHEN